MNSEIIISRGIKVDKDYTNVINYTQADMVALCRANQAASLANFSFIRDKGTIKADFNYSQALTCNYMAFQNPDYSNKWFFAWIDSIEYWGENCIEIRYTIDNWSTWWTAINFVPVMVEREHVNDDTIWTNLVPEPLGNMPMQNYNTASRLFDDFFAVIYFYDQNGGYYINGKFMTPLQNYGAYTNDGGVALLKHYIEDLQGDYNSVVGISLVPRVFAETPEGATEPPYMISYPYNLHQINNQLDVNGYVPVNNKLLSYPYCYVVADNGHSQVVLKLEENQHGNRLSFSFRIVCSYLVPNGSVTLYPDDYDHISRANMYALSITDFPQVPFCVDSYKAWLAQKSNSQLISGFNNMLMGAGAGFMTGGVGGAVIGAMGGAVSAIASYAVSEQQAKDESNSVKGNSVGSNNVLANCCGFHFKQVGLKPDCAKSVDNFFSQFGYQVNCVKQPNITGRQYWNYVKINGVCGSGNLPESSRNEINRILNQGTTIWHSHNNVGNYLVGGAKMQNPII